MALANYSGVWGTYVMLGVSLSLKMLKSAYNETNLLWNSSIRCLDSCSWFRCCYSLTWRVSVQPFKIISCCRVAIWAYIMLLFSWIFQKTCFFQLLSFWLIFLSFCWNLYMGLPLMVVESSHHCLMLVLKSRWSNQKISNLKGLFLALLLGSKLGISTSGPIHWLEELSLPSLS